MSYGTVIFVSWVALILVWSVGAFNVKRDIRGGGFTVFWYRYWPLRVVGIALVLFVLARIATGTVHFARADAFVFSRTFFTPPLLLGWVAAVLTALGVLFAIWARVRLGRNWSSVPAVKEGHELVTDGPYRYVRHPIYTGILLAALGYALTGTLFGFLILIIACILFFRRIGKEERIMLELFPDAYPAYQARTKRLIPFVW